MRLFNIFRRKKHWLDKWIGEKEFLEYGFIKTENSRYQLGDIIIKHTIYDHWHVFKGREDLGRFYTDWALRDRVKEHFNIVLTFNE